MRPNPEEIAVMLIAMVRRVGGKRGGGSRWRFSDQTLRKVSGRSIVRTAFVDELQEELAQFGYTILPLVNGGYGMIETAATESWPLIAGRDRLTNEFAAMRADDRTTFEQLIEYARHEFITNADQDAEA